MAEVAQVLARLEQLEKAVQEGRARENELRSQLQQAAQVQQQAQAREEALAQRVQQIQATEVSKAEEMASVVRVAVGELSGKVRSNDGKEIETQLLSKV